MTKSDLIELLMLKDKPSYDYLIRGPEDIYSFSSKHMKDLIKDKNKEYMGMPVHSLTIIRGFPLIKI